MVTKITTAVTPLEEIDKINEIIDAVDAVSAGKVDLNAQNLSNAGKSLIAGFGMPSDVYEEYTMPTAATETTKTAPANGYFSLRARTGTISSSVVLYKNSGNYIRTASFAPHAGTGMGVFLPVKKGDVIIAYVFDYSSNTEYNHFRFVYAKGEI